MTFKTMLAGKADPARMRFPMLVSPKLDGVRCHIIDGVAVSRNLKPFKNPEIQRIFGKKKFNGLDGEFMVGDPTHAEAFRQTGILNAHGGDCSEVKLFVFDDFTWIDTPFWHRLDNANYRVQHTGNGVLSPVEHHIVTSESELDSLEAKFLEQGYEGAMIRDPDGPYKFGRSTTREGWLLKLKRFEDSEAVIDDVEELMHNANEKTLERNGKMVRNTKKEGKIGRGILGAVQVRDIHTGIAFNVGSGFTDAERYALWAQHWNGELVGKVIKYQFFPTGSKDKPRFPTFKGFRDEGDI